MTLLWPALLVIAGLALLVKAAEVFVGGAEGVAVHLRWPPAVIGAVVVGFGTSLPELVASAVAAFAGEPDLAIGNAAGSNVANLLLILGVAAVIAPIRGAASGPGRDIALAGGAGLVLIGLSIDGRLGLLDAALLLVALVVATAWQSLSARSTAARATTASPGPRGTLTPLLLRSSVGLVGVIAGAQALVWGATRIATAFEVPAIVVGSVMVAIGTSLPELATATASARRGQTELLIGNLIGSNLFNALGVVGVAALIGASRGDVLRVDPPALVVVVAAGAVTCAVGLWLWRHPQVSRLAGAALVVLYAAAIPLLLAVS